MQNLIIYPCNSVGKSIRPLSERSMVQSHPGVLLGDNSHSRRTSKRRSGIIGILGTLKLNILSCERDMQDWMPVTPSLITQCYF